LKTGLALAGTVLVLDQATKLLVQGALSARETVPVIPGFLNLVHVTNRGAAFGFLNSENGWQAWFFIGATLIAVGVVLSMLRSEQAARPPAPWALGLILGGALGNLADRLRLGGVVFDFIDIYAGRFHWPAFNVADMAITTGVCLLIVSFYATRRPERPPQEKPERQ
jgi:signal peptidase II